MPSRKPKSDLSSAALSSVAASPSAMDKQSEQVDAAFEQVEHAMRRLEQAHKDFATARDEVAHQHRLTLLGTMVGAIAHEINNVLTPALSYSQLALAQPSDPALTKKALERAANGAVAISKITATILEFAKDRRFHVERGGQYGVLGSEIRQCNVEQVVHQAIGCLVRDPVKDGVRLEIEVDPALGVATEAIMLQQVLVNLFANAVRSMRGSNGRLQIVGERVGDDVVIDVLDNGPGVAPEIAARLFTGVVSGEVPRGTGGTGLGLLISRMLIESDGGSLELMKSQIGAHFRVTLPVI